MRGPRGRYPPDVAGWQDEEVPSASKPYHNDPSYCRSTRDLSALSVEDLMLLQATIFRNGASVVVDQCLSIRPPAHSKSKCTIRRTHHDCHPRAKKEHKHTHTRAMTPHMTMTTNGAKAAHSLKPSTPRPGLIDLEDHTTHQGIVCEPGKHWVDMPFKG